MKAKKQKIAVKITEKTIVAGIVALIGLALVLWFGVRITGNVTATAYNDAVVGTLVGAILFIFALPSLSQSLLEAKNAKRNT